MRPWNRYWNEVFSTYGLDRGVLLNCWASMEFLHSPSLGRGRVAPTNQPWNTGKRLPGGFRVEHECLPSVCLQKDTLRSLTCISPITQIVDSKVSFHISSFLVVASEEDLTPGFYRRVDSLLTVVENCFDLKK